MGSVDVASVAREWESLRGMRSRAEISEDAYLRRCEELSDSLGVDGESGDGELAYRIDLLRCLENGTRDSGRGIAETIELLPFLWELHLSDPVRFPAHPDAVGGATGAGDGEGDGELPNLFDMLWQDAVLAASLDPDVDAGTLGDLASRAFSALSELGKSGREIAETRVRFLLAVGRLDEAQRLLDDLPVPSLPDEPTWEGAYGFQRDMDVRGMIALQRGDLGVAADIVETMSGAPETRSQPTVILAESLIPLASTVPAEDTRARAAFVADRAGGDPGLSDALLQVAEFLAQTGHERTALGLVDRLLPFLGLADRDIDRDVHLLEGLHTVYRWASEAGLGEVRPVLAGLPAVAGRLAEVAGEGPGTVDSLADWAGSHAREAAAALDRRNGNDVESTVGLGLHVLPGMAPEREAADDTDADTLGSRVLAAIPPSPLNLPDWLAASHLDLPGEVADWQGGVSGTATPEVPVAGPADVAGFGEQDAVAATMLYSMLGLSEAVDTGVDRLVELRESGRPLQLGPLVGELVRRYELSVVFMDAEGPDDADPEGPDDGMDDAGPGGSDDPPSEEAPDDPVVADLDRMLRTRQEAQEEAENADASPQVILTNRVEAISGVWEDSHPVVRAMIEQDILMGGIYPDQHAVVLALRALRRVTRYAPRSIPQVGAGLLIGLSGCEGSDPDAVCALAQYITAVALSLPERPDDAGLMLGTDAAPDLWEDLSGLALALAGHAAYLESVAVYDRALALLPGEDHAARVQLMSSRADVLAAMGNSRSAAESYSETAANAVHWGLWEYAAESHVRCLSACLDDNDFPRAAMVLDSLDDIDGLDWMRFPDAAFRREVQATRLATALTEENFGGEWPGQFQRLQDAYGTYREAAGQAGPGPVPGALRAASDLVDGVLAVNRGLVHTNRVDTALELTVWAAGEAKTAETGPAASSAPSAEGQQAAPRLEALTEEALLLHVAGRDDEALMIFESVVQQARRAEVPWLVDGVESRLAAAARYARHEDVRDRYAALLGEIGGGRS